MEAKFPSLTMIQETSYSLDIMTFAALGSGATYDLSGRMILGVTDDDDSASAGFDFVSLGDTFFGVVGALGMKIGMDFADYCAHIFFREDHYGIDVRQRSQNFRALFGGHHGTAFS